MDRARLERLVERLEGMSYPAYRELKGRWRLGPCTVIVDHVQGDPFASPSRVRVRVQHTLPSDLIGDRDRREAAEDWLLRRFGQRLGGGVRRGSGKSGLMRVYTPGPEIVERSAVRIQGETIEARFQIGLPARGRRILGREAAALLMGDVPRAAAALAVGDGLAAHVASVVAQRSLRSQLRPRGLVGFVANGAILPRSSGVDQTPLRGAVPFQSPPELEVVLETAAGPVSGMGVPEGITLIVGGGFHGKSTLLQALQRGHLDHRPGDGREQVVSRPRTVKVRAEDGRRVCGVDISAFLSDLPGGRSTSPFNTDDASGSTSQAAAIVEGVEAGAEVLLIDEDTSATNLLVCDARMRRLIPRESEPITPFVERVRQIKAEWGVSTVMVVGGVGDYLSVADRVIAMDAYRPRDVTAAAKAIAGPDPGGPDGLGAVVPRVPRRQGLQSDKIRARDADRLAYGGGEINLSAVEQVLDPVQAATIGEALRLMHDELVDGRRHIGELLDALDAIVDDEGVEALAPRDYPPGDLVRARRFEVAAALSRLRSLQVEGT